MKKHLNRHRFKTSSRTLRLRGKLLVLAGLYLIVAFGGMESIRAAPVILTDDQDVFTAAPRLEVLEDKGFAYRISDLRTRSDLPWTRNNKRIVDLGFTASVWWFRLTLKNDSSDDFQGFLLLEWNALDRIELYGARGGDSPLVAGDRLPFTRWSVRSLPPAFRINLAPGKSETYYLRLQTSSFASFPIRVYSGTKYHEHLRARTGITWLYGGLIALLIVYSIYLFGQFRQWIFIWYVVYMALVALTVFIGYGNAYQVLWPDWPEWHNRSQLIFFPLSVAAGLQFSRSYLNTRRMAAKLDIYFRVMQWALVPVALLAAGGIPYRFLSPVLSLGWMAATLLAWVTAILVRRRGYRPALIYAIVWGLFFVTGWLNGLVHLRIVPYHAVLLYAAPLSLPVDFLLLSYGLHARIQELRAEKDRFLREKSELLRRLGESPESIRYRRSVLASLDVDRVLLSLNRVLEEERMYVMEDIKLADLANALSISQHQLSEILNSVLDTSFPRLINEYRIAEVKRLLRDKTENTILEHAFSVGFQSKATFNAAFKRIAGMTPREFKNLK